MKNLAFIINAVLIIAVGILYYLHFSAPCEPAKEGSTGGSTGALQSIVYVNSDTLLERYEYYQRIRNRLIDKKDSLEAVLESRGRKLEEEVRDYQEKAGGMTPSQRALLEDGLVKKEQRLYEQREEILDKLSREEAELTNELHRKLYGYLDQYNSEKKYDYILGFQRGSGILHANDSLDITFDVLKGLNEQEK